MSTVAVSSGSVIASTVTGGVALAGAAIVGVGLAPYQAYKFLSKEAEAYLAKNNEMVDRLDSPQSLAELAQGQQAWLMKDPYFLKQTKDLSEQQRQQLAGAYVTSGTPLEATYTELVVKHSTSPIAGNLISLATQQFGVSNFKQVASTLEVTATEFGFDYNVQRFSSSHSKIMTFQKKGSEEQMTVVVSKDPQNLATTMAIDLHGFDCNTDRCMNVMGEFEARLKEKGLKFSFKKERHNLPEGKLLNKLKAKKVTEQIKAKQSSRTNMKGNPAKKVTQ